MLIAWNDERNGTSPHQSVNHAMAQMERMGYETGLWDTYIRSDSNMISLNPKMTTGQPNNSGINLSKADAIFALGYRMIELDDSQKADLISFIKDRGKGFVGSHMAATMFEPWMEFHKILGGWYDGHAYGTIPVPIVNEDPNFPAMKHIPATFTFTDEWYAMREWSRENIRVLLRIDMSKLPGSAILARGFQTVISPWPGPRCTARGVSFTQLSPTHRRHLITHWSTRCSLKRSSGPWD